VCIKQIHEYVLLLYIYGSVVIEIQLIRFLSIRGVHGKHITKRNKILFIYTYTFCVTHYNMQINHYIYIYTDTWPVSPSLALKGTRPLNMMIRKTLVIYQNHLKSYN